MALTRFSEIIRNIYKSSVQTDPETINNPDTGSVFEGVYDFKRWTKHPDGTIVYSRSDEYVEIVDITGDTLTPQLNWNGKFIRWTNPQNGVLTLPETSTLSLPVGWLFTIYNDTDQYSIEILTGGTDVIKSHNNIFFIPAESEAQIGKLVEGTPNQYYADIEQSTSRATGAVGQGNAGGTVAVLANTWTAYPIPLPVVSDLMRNVTHIGDGQLQLNYPNNEQNGCMVRVNGTAAIALNNNDQIVDLSFMINGVAGPGAEIFRQSARSAGNQTQGMYWPFSFNYEGLIRNGDIIQLMIRSSAADTIEINSSSLQIFADAYTGVNIQ